jgi:hypothetical protein
MLSILINTDSPHHHSAVDLVPGKIGLCVVPDQSKVTGIPEVYDSEQTRVAPEFRFRRNHITGDKIDARSTG